MSLWIIFLVISTAFAVKNKCPGGTYTCPDSATCCQLNDKSYGCCPMENAVCCDDHIHCCPENTKCATGMCLQNNRSMESHLLRSNDVICDDKSVCPDDTTCCQNPQTRTFGCCPFEDAVCCDDGLHCCPGGTICNLEERKCDGDGFVTHLYDSHKKSFDTMISNITLSPLRHNKEYNVICPGEESQCPDGYTCCKLPNQDYGCCPFVRASCCKDGLHCCPEHMHCDATSQYCSQGPRNVTSLRHIPSKKISDKNVCPDHSSCEDIETCCKMSNSTYGCCRYANATCCSDLLSCCPSDMVCDVKNKRCLRKQDLVVSFLNNMV